MARIDVLDRSCHCADFRIRCLSSCRYETLIKAVWRRRKYLFWLEVQGYSRHCEEVMVAGSLASWSRSIWGQGAERKFRYFSLCYSVLDPLDWYYCPKLGEVVPPQLARSETPSQTYSEVGGVRMSLKPIKLKRLATAIEGTCAF